MKRWLATLDLVGNKNNKNTTMTLVEALSQPFIGLVLKLVDNGRSSTTNTFGPQCLCCQCWRLRVPDRTPQNTNTNKHKKLKGWKGGSEIVHCFDFNSLSLKLTVL